MGRGTAGVQLEGQGESWRNETGTQGRSQGGKAEGRLKSSILNVRTLKQGRPKVKGESSQVPLDSGHS